MVELTNFKPHHVNIISTKCLDCCIRETETCERNCGVIRGWMKISASLWLWAIHDSPSVPDCNRPHNEVWRSQTNVHQAPFNWYSKPFSSEQFTAQDSLWNPVKEPTPQRVCQCMFLKKSRMNVKWIQSTYSSCTHKHKKHRWMYGKDEVSQSDAS